jgi:hypothetical protein
METHERYEQLIDELILDAAAPETSPKKSPSRSDDKAAHKWQTLRAHLLGCPRCRERYDRVALAERMLHGGPGALSTPSPSSFARIGAAVIAQATARPSAQQRLVQWLAHPRRWVAGVATAAALAVLIPFFVARQHGDEFQSRGGARGERLAGVRAFCLDDNGVTPRCTRDSQLRLTVSNGGKFRYVFLFGLDDAHAVKWYAPRPPETSSVAAPAGSDVPIGDAMRLGVNHDPGTVRVYALFSDAPVSSTDIEASIEKMHTTKPSLTSADADPLPLARTDVVQHSVTFDVQP